MRIELDTLLENGIIDSGKITEIICDSKSIWKGYSDQVENFAEDYTFVKFNKEKTEEFNEAFYKIEVAKKNNANFLHEYTEAKAMKDNAQMQYGIPEEGKFPMYDKAHVLSAIKFFNYVEPKYEEQLAKAIKKQMDKYGITYDHVGEENRLSKYLK